MSTTDSEDLELFFGQNLDVHGIPPFDCPQNLEGLLKVECELDVVTSPAPIEDPMPVESKHGVKRKISTCSTISTSSSCSSLTSSDSDYEPQPPPPQKKRRGRRPAGGDKKERKRLQNKKAAIRYRNKKKQEEEVVEEVENELLEKNTELKSEVARLETEVSCLKKLMKEILTARGVTVPKSEK